MDYHLVQYQVWLQENPRLNHKQIKERIFAENISSLPALGAHQRNPLDRPAAIAACELYKKALADPTVARDGRGNMCFLVLEDWSVVPRQLVLSPFVTQPVLTNHGGMPTLEANFNRLSFHPRPPLATNVSRPMPAPGIQMMNYRTTASDDLNASPSGYYTSSDFIAGHRQCNLSRPESNLDPTARSFQSEAETSPVSGPATSTRECKLTSDWRAARDKNSISDANSPTQEGELAKSNGDIRTSDATCSTSMFEIPLRNEQSSQQSQEKARKYFPTGSVIVPTSNGHVVQQREEETRKLLPFNISTRLNAQPHGVHMTTSRLQNGNTGSPRRELDPATFNLQGRGEPRYRSVNELVATSDPLPRDQIRDHQGPRWGHPSPPPLVRESPSRDSTPSISGTNESGSDAEGGVNLPSQDAELAPPLFDNRVHNHSGAAGSRTSRPNYAMGEELPEWRNGVTNNMTAINASQRIEPAFRLHAPVPSPADPVSRAVRTPPGLPSRTNPLSVCGKFKSVWTLPSRDLEI